jgi:hypothetical protein
MFVFIANYVASQISLQLLIMILPIAALLLHSKVKCKVEECGMKSSHLYLPCRKPRVLLWTDRKHGAATVIQQFFNHLTHP